MTAHDIEFRMPQLQSLKTAHQGTIWFSSQGRRIKKGCCEKILDPGVRKIAWTFHVETPYF